MAKRDDEVRNRKARGRSAIEGGGNERKGDECRSRIGDGNWIKGGRQWVNYEGRREICHTSEMLPSTGHEISLQETYSAFGISLESGRKCEGEWTIERKEDWR